MTTARYNIQVEIAVRYLAEHSDPEQNRYTFAYHIAIANVGSVAARLHSRHWVITDADGGVQEVRGEGVVGKQPNLAPGASFEYTSGAVIKTPVGSMQGSYRMMAADGVAFDAEIAPFSLAVPNMVH